MIFSAASRGARNSPNPRHGGFGLAALRGSPAMTINPAVTALRTAIANARTTLDFQRARVAIADAYGEDSITAAERRDLTAELLDAELVAARKTDAEFRAFAQAQDEAFEGITVCVER